MTDERDNIAKELAEIKTKGFAKGSDRRPDQDMFGVF